MTFESHRLYYVVGAMMLLLCLVRGDEEYTRKRQNWRVKRSMSTDENQAGSQTPDTSFGQTRNAFGLFEGNLRPLDRTFPDGRHFVKRADGGYGGPLNLLPELRQRHFLHNLAVIPLVPGYARDFTRKLDPNVDSISSALPPVNIPDINKGDLDPGALEHSQIVVDKRHHSATANTDLWKRIPLELFTRHAPQYSHKFVGKRFSGKEFNKLEILRDFYQESSHSPRPITERSTTSLPWHRQHSVGRTPTYSNFDPAIASPYRKLERKLAHSLSHSRVGKRTVHGVFKREITTDNKVPFSGHNFLSNGQDYLEDSSDKDKHEDRVSYFPEELAEKTRFEHYNDNSDSPLGRSERGQTGLRTLSSRFLVKRPNFGHRFVGKRNTKLDTTLFGKRPNFGHKFVGKRDPKVADSLFGKRSSFGNMFDEKRDQNFEDSLFGKLPNFGHKFVGKRDQRVDDSLFEKRPNFSHKFLGKRIPEFDLSFLGKRPQFGHKFVGKRDQVVDNSFLEKRPRFGHRFVGKRPSFGHRFVGKRPSFGHRFVGKRPSFGHRFVGKRPSFGHRFVGKRPSFGHRFVGKRDSADSHSLDNNLALNLKETLVEKLSRDNQEPLEVVHVGATSREDHPTSREDHPTSSEDHPKEQITTEIRSNASSNVDNMLGGEGSPGFLSTFGEGRGSDDNDGFRSDNESKMAEYFMTNEKHWNGELYGVDDSTNGNNLFQL